MGLENGSMSANLLGPRSGRQLVGLSSLRQQFRNLLGGQNLSALGPPLRSRDHRVQTSVAQFKLHFYRPLVLGKDIVLLVGRFVDSHVGLDQQRSFGKPMRARKSNYPIKRRTFWHWHRFLFMGQLSQMLGPLKARYYLMCAIKSQNSLRTDPLRWLLCPF